MCRGILDLHTFIFYCHEQLRCPRLCLPPQPACTPLPSCHSPPGMPSLHTCQCSPHLQPRHTPTPHSHPPHPCTLTHHTKENRHGCHLYHSHHADLGITMQGSLGTTEHAHTAYIHMPPPRLAWTQRQDYILCRVPLWTHAVAPPLLQTRRGQDCALGGPPYGSR